MLLLILLFFLNSILNINDIDEDLITSYITESFFKDIFFTQLAVIDEDELFNNSTIINPLKLFLKKAFILHLNLEISRLDNQRIDNHHTLEQIKELDCLTSGLIIPNFTQKNAANQVDKSTILAQNSRARRSRRLQV